MKPGTAGGANLTLMKDFCRREQVFFNETDRINFLSQQSKNHYRLYKHAFDGSTTKYLQRQGRHSLKSQTSEQDFQSQLERLNAEYEIPGVQENTNKGEVIDQQSIQRRSIFAPPSSNSPWKRDKGPPPPDAFQNRALLRQEFDKFTRQLESGDPDAGALGKKRRFRRRRVTIDEYIERKEEGLTLPAAKRSDPVNRLARTLRRYKEKRLKSEDELVKVMEKVKLDKGILLKEKIDSIWGSMGDKSNFKEVKHEIDMCKQRRHELNTRQREAYLELLRHLKNRRGGIREAKGTGITIEQLPVAEEKQLLDALKIVLENGYCIGDYELVQIFDMIGLRAVAGRLSKESPHFMQFIARTATLFQIDPDVIKAYFHLRGTDESKMLRVDN